MLSLKLVITEWMPAMSGTWLATSVLSLFPLIVAFSGSVSGSAPVALTRNRIPFLMLNAARLVVTVLSPGEVEFVVTIEDPVPTFELVHSVSARGNDAVGHW